jgi:hypothetical protein
MSLPWCRAQLGGNKRYQDQGVSSGEEEKKSSPGKVEDMIYGANQFPVGRYSILGEAPLYMGLGV